MQLTFQLNRNIRQSPDISPPSDLGQFKEVTLF